MRAALFRPSTLPPARLSSGWVVTGATNLPKTSRMRGRQGAEAPAEPGERIAKSPLQCTLTARIMSRWAKHEGALAHISLKRSIEMLEL